MTLALFMLFVAIYLAIYLIFKSCLKMIHRLNNKPGFIRVKPSSSKSGFNRSCMKTRKPEWVVKEVLRLKAFMPNAGCRSIATTFNRIHGKKMTVSKSYCADKIKRHNYEIQVLRRKI